MELVRSIKNTVDQIFKLITPPQYFSWQTLILLSVFSWLMSLLSQAAWLEELLINFAWLFMIAGIHWALVQNPFRIGGLSIAPWVTGALVCIFLFSQGAETYFHWAVVSWPLVSAAIAALPHFLTWDLRWRIPTPRVRQDLVLLVLINLVLSCWFQFHFLVQDWLQDYPSLLADDFGRSNFVLAWEEQPAQTPRGIALLEQVEAQIRAQVGERPWPYAERWLANLDQRLPRLKQDAFSQLADSTENNLWTLTGEPRTAGEGYALSLRAIWQGPSSYPEGYFLEKTCQITRQTPSAAPRIQEPSITGSPATPSPADTTPVAIVQCTSVETIQPTETQPEPTETETGIAS